MEGKLKFIFGMFDMNQDRTVSAGEISQVLRALNPDLGFADAKMFTMEIFKDAWGDDDENKVISFKEFVKAHDRGKVLQDMWFRFFP